MDVVQKEQRSVIKNGAKHITYRAFGCTAARVSSALCSITRRSTWRAQHAFEPFNQRC